MTKKDFSEEIKFKLERQDISHSVMYLLFQQTQWCRQQKEEVYLQLHGSRYDKRISFHISGTPGRHQWLQSGTDGLSLQIPTWPSLRNAPIGVTCIIVTGTAIFRTTFIMVSETGLRSIPQELNQGRWPTLQEWRCRPLLQIQASIAVKFCLAYLYLKSGIKLN